MSEYRNLKMNPPKLEVKKDSTQVVVQLVSCMCDNKYTFIFEKDSKNFFRLNTGRFAYSNFQIPVIKQELEFLADVSEWDEVFKLINGGTSAIKKVMSR